MAKNNSSNGVGDKITRGADNPILLPGSTPQEEPKSFEEVIGSAVDKILASLENNKDDINNVIGTAVTANKTFYGDVKDLLESFKKSFDEKMTALLGAIYGMPNAQPTYNASRFLSQLGRINTSKTFFADLFNAVEGLTSSEGGSLSLDTSDLLSNDTFIDTMNEVLQAMSPDDNLSTYYKSVLNSIETLLQDNIESLKKIINGESKNVQTIRNEVVMEGVSNDTLAKIAELLTKTPDGGLNVDSLVAELNKLQAISQLPPLDSAYIDNVKAFIESFSDIDVLPVNSVIDKILQASTDFENALQQFANINVEFPVVDDFLSKVRSLNTDLNSVILSFDGFVNELNNMQSSIDAAAKVDLTPIYGIIDRIKNAGNSLKDAYSVFSDIKAPQIEIPKVTAPSNIVDDINVEAPHINIPQIPTQEIKVDAVVNTDAVQESINKVSSFDVTPINTAIDRVVKAATDFEAAFKLFEDIDVDMSKVNELVAQIGSLTIEDNFDVDGLLKKFDKLKDIKLPEIKFPEVKLPDMTVTAPSINVTASDINVEASKIGIPQIPTQEIKVDAVVNTDAVQESINKVAALDISPINDVINKVVKAATDFEAAFKLFEDIDADFSKINDLVAQLGSLTIEDNFDVDGLLNKFDKLKDVKLPEIKFSDMTVTAPSINVTATEVNVETPKIGMPQIPTQEIKVEAVVNTDAVQESINKVAALDVTPINDVIEKVIKAADGFKTAFALFEGVDVDLTSINRITVQLGSIGRMLSGTEFNVDSLTQAIDSLSILNTLPDIDEHFVDKFVDLMKALTSVDDSIDIDPLVTELSKLTALNSLPSIDTSVIEDLAQFNVKLPELDIDAIKSRINEIVDLVQKTKEAGVTSDEMRNAGNAGNLMSVVLNGFNIDEKKLGDIDSFLRRMIKLTEKPNLLTKLHMSDRGLLWQVIRNVTEAASMSNVTEKSVEGIGKLLRDIIEIGTSISSKELDKVEENMLRLRMIVDAQHLQGFLNDVSNIELPDKGIIDDITSTIIRFNGIQKLLSAKDILIFGLDLSLATWAVGLISPLFATVNKIGGQTESVIENAENIRKALIAISKIGPDNIENAKDMVDKSNDLAKSLAILAITSVFAEAGAKDMPKIFQALETAIDSIPEINYREDIRNIDNISSLIKSIGVISGSLALIAITAPLAIVGAYALKLEIGAIKTAIDKINELEIDKDTTERIKGMSILLTVCAGILIGAAVAGEYILEHAGALLMFGVILTAFIASVVKAVNWATKDINDAKYNALQIAELIALSGGIMLIGGAIMTMAPQLILGSLGFGLALGVFIATVVKAYEWSTKNGFKDISDNIDQLEEIVIGSAALMIVGGLFMLIPGMPLAALEFGVELAAFIGGITYVYKTFGEGISEAQENADKFAILVATSAASLLVGGLLFYINPWMIGTTLLFGVELLAFIAGVTFAYNTFGQGIGEAQEHADKFAILIATSAATLLIGGLIFKENPWMIGTTLLFGVELVAFIGAVTFAYNTFAQGIGEAQQTADKFAVLVATAGATLLIGAYLFKENPWMIGTALLFGVELAAFIVLIGGAYALAARLMKGSIEVADEFYILVGLSAATLIIGGLFTLIPGMNEAIISFGLTLVGFVALIGLAYKVFANDMKKTMPAALALSALVAVSAATLLVGGMMFLNNEGLLEASIAFALTTTLFVGAFAGMVFVLGKFLTLPQLAFGLLAVFAITLIIDSFVDTFRKVNDVAQVLDTDKMWDAMLGMLALVGGTALIVGILAGIIAIPGVGWLGAGMIAAAEVILAGLVKIIDMTAGAMKHVAEASTAWNRMEIPDADKIIEGIGKFVLISGALGQLAGVKTFVKMQIVKKNVSAMSSALMMIGTAVRSIAALTIPLLDENGKVVGLRNLEESDFNDAANNVKKIIKTLGGAIIEAYKEAPEGMFSAGTLGDLLSMDTPFSRVCKSCATMGTMISKIAEGVKEYADMRIAVYDNHGKKIGTRPLTSADFTNAAENIKTVITTLGQAIIDTYEGHEEMFADTKSWWQPGVRTPFAMVVKATSGMGKLISSIAASVKDYANLRVNVYDDSGKVIGTREMNEADFTNAATNVSKVLTLLGGAIIETYGNNPMMFTDPSTWHTDADKTPFGMVVKAMAGTGKLVSEGAQAIKDVLEMDIDWSDAAKQDVRNRVGFVLGILAQSILDMATGENAAAFQDESFWHTDPLKTPFGMVKQALSGTSKLVKEGMDVIKMVDSLPLANKQAIMDKVNLALSVLATTINDLATNDATKEAFEDDSFWHTDPQKTPFGMVKAALTGTSKLVMEAAAAIERINKIDIKGDIKKKVATILSSIPEGILKATVYNANEDYRDFWSDDDSIDAIKRIGKSYGIFTDVLDDVLKRYERLFKFLSNESAPDVNELRTAIHTIINSLPEVFNDLKIEQDLSALKNVLESYEIYGDAIDEVVKTYKSVWKLMSGGEGDEDKVNAIGQGLMNMLAMTARSLDIVAGEDGSLAALMKTKVDSFAASMEVYRDAVENLAEAFNLVPEDFTKYENVQKALRKINIEIEGTPDLTGFKDEAKTLNAYVKTVNSLDTDKVDSLTNLAVAMTEMSTKLGGLEGLTDVLANKVSGVLATLADRIDESAKTINTADKIQKDRHKKIEDTLKQLKALMDKPLNVKITHKAEEPEDTYTPGNGTDTGQTTQTSGGSTMTASTPGSGSTGSTGSSSSDGNSWLSNMWGQAKETAKSGLQAIGVDTKSKQSNTPQSTHDKTAANTSNISTETDNAYFDKKAKALSQNMVNAHQNDLAVNDMTGGAISARRAREIARQEAMRAIKEWQANNTKRGAGRRTGANA